MVVNSRLVNNGQDDPSPRARTFMIRIYSAVDDNSQSVRASPAFEPSSQLCKRSSPVRAAVKAGDSLMGALAERPSCRAAGRGGNGCCCLAMADS